MAVVLAVAAAVLVVVLVVVGLLTGSLAVVVLGVVEPALVVVGLVAVGWLARRRVLDWAERRLSAIAGPAIVKSISPRETVQALLDHVFGGDLPHAEITTALLGGGGHDISGRDVVVSRATTVRMTLTRIDERMCQQELLWSHEFAGVRDNHRLVMFATTNRDIFRLLTSNRVYPLFESWFLHNDEQLEDFERNALDDLEVGITYRDENGALHTVEPTGGEGERVELADYDRFVRLRGRFNRQELVIFQLHLYDLAHPDHVVEAVERLTLRVSTQSAFEEGFITWSAPHPCFVESVVFDVRDLPQPHEKLNYQVLIHTVHASYSEDPVPGVWGHVPEGIEVTPHSWMLPGHGVTLLWRHIDGAGSLHGSEHH